MARNYTPHPSATPESVEADVWALTTEHDSVRVRLNGWGSARFQVILDRLPASWSYHHTADGFVLTHRQRPAADDTFKATTMNVFYGTSVAKIKDRVRAFMRSGTQVFLLQEAAHGGLVDALQDLGLRVHRTTENVVAWDPARFKLDRRSDVALSRSTFKRGTGNTAGPRRSPRVILEERGTGRTLDVLSYHTPSDVQNGPGGAPGGTAARLRVVREAFATMRRLVADSPADAILWGGDDNYDERRHLWRIMHRPYTGLRLVQAPSGTIGRVRRIDDFRVRGLESLAGSVLNWASDHNAYTRTFRWRTKPRAGAFDALDALPTGPRYRA